MKTPKSSSKHVNQQHDSSGDGIHLDQTPFDAFEREVLQVSRLFFTAFHHPESQAWVNAFYLAEQRFHAPFGVTIANAVLMSVNAMRAARGTGFSYQNPNCQTCTEYITDEERYFIGTLHDIRRKNRSGAKVNAMLLCHGADDVGFTEALERLVIIIGDCEACALQNVRSNHAREDTR